MSIDYNEVFEKMENNKEKKTIDSSIKILRNLKIKDESIIHKDPFDKMLLAQSICENLTFCTRDSVLLNYDVPNIKIV